MRDDTPRILLKAGDLSAAIAARDVRQIVQAGGLSRVPLTRPGVIGVVVREGRAIPVYRLCSLMGKAAGPPDPGVEAETMDRSRRQVIILEHEGALAGILVDGADAMRSESARPETPVLLDKRTLLRNAGALGSLEGDVGACSAPEGDR